MTDRYVAIASFPDTAAAQRAKDQLAAAGIKALLVDPPRPGQPGDESGAVYLRVRETQTEQARLVLAAQPLTLDDEPPLPQIKAGRTFVQPPGPAADDGEEERESNEREQNAKRACLASIGGVLFFPFLFYAAFLLVQVWTSPQQLSREARRNVMVATVITGCFAVMLFFMVLSCLGLVPAPTLPAPGLGAPAQVALQGAG